MRRWVYFGVFALILLSVVVVLALWAWQRPSLVVSLPVGSGPSQVGVNVGETDVAPVCPLGIDVLDTGEIALVDTANLKLLVVDPTTSAVVQSYPIDLGEASLLEGATYTREGDELVVWLTEPNGKNSTLVRLIPTADDEELEVLDEQGFGASQDEEALAKMAGFGFPVDEAQGFSIGAGAQSVDKPETTSWSADFYTSQGNVGVAYFRQVGAEALSIEIVLADQELKVPYALSGSFVGARVVAVDEAAAAHIAITTERPSGGELSFAETVLAIPLDGSEAKTYTVPHAPDAPCVPKQNVAVAKNGEVYAITASEHAVQIVTLKAESWLALPSAVPPARSKNELDQAKRELLALEAEQRGSQDGKQTTRRKTVEQACSYLNHEWEMSAENDQPSARGICYYFTRDSCGKDGGKRCDIWLQPKRIRGRVGQTVSGIPYTWGGEDSLAEFDYKIGIDRPAGDVCTPMKGGGVIFDSTPQSVNGVYPAGVDCSGFVLRAWSWSGGRYTTSSLSNIATPIPKDQLRPGDILNDAGSHVRMFLAWRNGGQNVEFIESSTSCGGVCRRILPWSKFSGYVPLRFNYMTEVGGESDITYGDINQICGTL